MATENNCTASYSWIIRDINGIAHQTQPARTDVALLNRVRKLARSLVIAQLITTETEAHHNKLAAEYASSIKQIKKDALIASKTPAPTYVSSMDPYAALEQIAGVSIAKRTIDEHKQAKVERALLNQCGVLSFDQLPSSRSQAQQADSKYYFTGEKCFMGHLAPRNTRSARCVLCSIGVNERKPREHK